ncbi:hypothetical protein K3N28_12690 [Glycomyces sp. TRM65418]|uniref:type VII secretion target n=1 Tax=Glycomyces sp. TRM65418 TaxID=2867006 RepID=UPI001CE4FA48|nr:type VII secretion target [Glycomyces sp. TRM65418]MCC3763922.1 hypothetical protein [Glycomyces sp. TRM65418]QZD53624.1 hypothetical protein K3N28_12620 [Glycomyces sp. TRM65418]
MAGGQGYDVEPDALAQHGANLATDVGGVVDDAIEAGRATEGAGFNESYGVIISPIAFPVMEVVTANAMGAMESARSFIDALSQAVAGVAAAYDGVDAAIAEDLNKIAEEIN